MKLRHSDILPKGDAWLVTRAAPSRKRPKSQHQHDFFELFWVVNGTVRHRINGAQEDLIEGDLVFVRPDDTHSVQGRGEEPHLINVALHPKLVAALGKRHAALAGRFFWSDAAQPDRLHLDFTALSTLSQSLRKLENAPRDAFSAEAFLLPLLSGLLPVQAPQGMPVWLAGALDAARRREVFRDGAAGFVRAAGRAHAHVSRETRRHLGMSPSELIAQHRMEHAARQLVGTSDPLGEIAEEIGLPNLSHFHRQFRSHHGVTPAAYRKRYQRDVIQPD